MRVALDARRLQDRPQGGVGRMFANLVPLLAEQVDLVLLTDARRPPVPGPWAQRALWAPSHTNETVWLQSSVPNWLRHFDGVFHGTFNALPLASRVPSVVTIHDVSFREHPEDFKRAKRLLFAGQARHAAHVARAVTTLSTFIRDALVTVYGIDEERLFVTPPAVDPVFGPDRAEFVAPILAGLGVTGPYVVALGGARRRGLDVSVAAWQRWRGAGGAHQLVVVGHEVPPPMAGVAHAGLVSDETWAALLAGADALCYPTRYEGFGMPSLEAIASGTPVICAAIGPLPEILGDAAEWCAAPTPAGMADGLARLLGDPDRRQRLVAAGLARAAAAPTWADSASVLLAAYTLAAGR